MHQGAAVLCLATLIVVAGVASSAADSGATTFAEFEQCDSDGDGVLSNKEFAAFVTDRTNGTLAFGRSLPYMRMHASIQHATDAIGSIWK
jgi:hypothetical protein